ncbi:MAG: hypothetical protein IT287_03735 [Bdellovibrionaceae bacterium]|nr:hypothetical protein [Pseudobdellovibrionaceae bacterium]
MKLSKFFMSVFATLLLTNCSTHPEIKPYEEPKEEAAVEESLPYGQAISDSVFSDSLETDSSMPTEFDDRVDMAEEDEATPAKEVLEKEVPVKKTIVVQKAPKAGRQPASAGKGGMFTFKADCVMKTQPDDASENAGSVSAGKKLWLDTHDATWFKAYKKSGTVYVPSTCVQ